MPWRPAAADAWSGRDDGNDPRARRWHQAIQPWEWQGSDAASGTVVIIGYAVDAGVRRNKGRAGAAEAPTALRRACSNLPCPVQPIALADGGDVIAEGDDVLGAQQELARRVASAQSRGARTLVFGGGHDVAFGHWLGLATRDGSAPRDGVTASVNLDAHLDNRPVPPEGPNSGTSYSQMQEWCVANSRSFAALALGIQRASNTAALFARAQEQGVRLARTGLPLARTDRCFARRGRTPRARAPDGRLGLLRSRLCPRRKRTDAAGRRTRGSRQHSPLHCIVPCVWC